MANERKRKRTSGLTGLELRLAYNTLLKFKSTLVPTDESNADPTEITQGPEELVPVDFKDTLDVMLAMMESKINGPHVYRIIPHTPPFAD
jgi:hypothetical protein